MENNYSSRKNLRYTWERNRNNFTYPRERQGFADFVIHVKIPESMICGQPWIGKLKNKDMSPQTDYTLLGETKKCISPQ